MGWSFYYNIIKGIVLLILFYILKVWMHIFLKIKFISYFKLSLLSCVYNYQKNYRFINNLGNKIFKILLKLKYIVLKKIC